jgi:hypothetical protein
MISVHEAPERRNRTPACLHAPGVEVPSEHQPESPRLTDTQGHEISDETGGRPPQQRPAFLQSQWRALCSTPSLAFSLFPLCVASLA